MTKSQDDNKPKKIAYNTAAVLCKPRKNLHVCLLSASASDDKLAEDVIWMIRLCVSLADSGEKLQAIPMKQQDNKIPICA